MPLVGNALTFRCFRVHGKGGANTPEKIRGGFERYPFKAQPSSRTEEPNFGWVELGQAGKEVLTPLFAGNIAAASVRFDRKRINAAAFALAFDARCKEIMEARGLERLGANHRQEIKEALKEELLAGVIPAVSLVDLVWSLDTGEVWIFTSSDAAVDLIRPLFLDSFGFRLYEDRAHDWLLPEHKPNPQPNEEGFDCNDIVEGKGTALSGFLSYLMADGLCGHSAASGGWWLEDKALFDNLDNGRTLVSGPGLAPDAPEVESITAAGKVPMSITVGYRPPGGDSEWHATLKACGTQLRISGLKVPACVKDGQEEVVLERHYLIGLFLTALREAFVRYWDAVVIGGESNEEGESP